jgi:hypothetical protein
MCSHCLVEPTACTPAMGWEKGQVENQVGNAREHLFTPRLHFANYAELNAWLEPRCLAQVRTSAHPEHGDQTVWEVSGRDVVLNILARQREADPPSR